MQMKNKKIQEILFTGHLKSDKKKNNRNYLFVLVWTFYKN